jgi:hypothetical protein
LKYFVQAFCPILFAAFAGISKRRESRNKKIGYKTNWIVLQSQETFAALIPASAKKMIGKMHLSVQ